MPILNNSSLPMKEAVPSPKHHVMSCHAIPCRGCCAYTHHSHPAAARCDPLGPLHVCLLPGILFPLPVPSYGLRRRESKRNVRPAVALVWLLDGLQGCCGGVGGDGGICFMFHPCGWRGWAVALWAQGCGLRWGFGGVCCRDLFLLGH